MYVATIPNRGSPPAILLRESYREAGKTKNRTLANLSDGPSERIELFRAVLRGDPLGPLGGNGFEIHRSLPHGHVLAALSIARRIGLDDLLPRRGSQRRRDLALALIVAKLATARMLDTATASHSLGHRPRDLHHPRLARQRAGLYRKPASASPPQERRAGAVRCHLYLPRGTLLSAGTPRLQPR
jgi:hypothetical protein